MEGIVPRGFGERRLIRGALERVLAVLDPIGPGQKHLAASNRADLILPVPVDDVAAADGVDAEPRPHLGDDGTLVAQGQDVLLPRWRAGGHRNRIIRGWRG